MENGPSEDACHFLLKMGMFHCYVSLPEGHIEYFLEADSHIFHCYFQIQPPKFVGIFLLEVLLSKPPLLGTPTPAHHELMENDSCDAGRSHPKPLKNVEVKNNGCRKAVFSG